MTIVDLVNRNTATVTIVMGLLYLVSDRVDALIVVLQRVFSMSILVGLVGVGVFFK